MRSELLESYAAKMSGVLGRPVGPREAEDEIVRVAYGMADTLSSKMKFGYHDLDDVRQQAVLFALEALQKTAYDVERPIENFLYVHMKNRLSNYKRDNFMRSEAPCKCCDPFDPPRVPCRRWEQWYSRNMAKQTLMRSVEGSDENCRVESTVHEEVEKQEALRLIDLDLPADLRKDYLRMRDGAKVPKDRRDRVKRAVLQILGHPQDD